MKHWVILIYFFTFWVHANTEAQDFTALSIDELMQIEVTSVSKKSERLSQAAAAVYVVTQNEIKRSGATSIPEALRLVPGVDVVQIDPNQWAIGMRGFNGSLANKLLVMIDGQSVYTPTFSGVYWENIDYLLADIERIEVIRGPGATLWGTNAVNGVINIITKEASETIGGIAAVSVGNELNAMAAIRQGVELSDHAQVRVYAKGKDLDESKSPSGRNQDNGGEYLTSGFRLDWQGENDQQGTVQGDLFRRRLKLEHSTPQYTPPYGESPLNGDVNIDGANLSMLWRKHIGLDSEFQASVRYDYYDREDVKYGDKRDTIDFEFQHQFILLEQQELVWGGGYRYSRNEISNGLLGSVEEAKEDMDIWDVFIQDKIRFPAIDTSVTIGVKLEGNNYSDVEVQPNIRASWAPSNMFTLWSAISRAKRIPSRAETDIRFDLLTYAPGVLDPNVPLPSLLRIEGNSDFDAEQLDAYEIGLRWMPNHDIAWDLAFFYNQYENLRSYVPGATSVENIEGQDFAVVPLVLDNNISGYTQGLELLATWQASTSSRYRVTYSYIDIELEDSRYSIFSDNMVTLVEDRAPQHQASIWASYDLTENWFADVRLFYIDERPWNLNQPGGVEARVNADARIAWKVNSSVELSLMGRNILEDAQQEFITEIWSSSSEIERSFFLKAEVKW